MAEADKQGSKVGGAYIEITADSGPAEKAAATFFNWFAKTGEAATELAGKISSTIEKTKELGEKGTSSVKKVTTEFQTMTRGITDANSTISADSKKTFDQMKKDAKLSYSEMTKDSKAMNRALVISMQDSISNLKSSFTDLKNGFKNVGTAILDMFKQPVKAIKSIPNQVQNAMKSVSGFVSSGFAQAINQAISHLQQIPVKATQAINRTKDVFVTGFNSIVNAAANTISKVGNSLSQLPSKASQTANNFKNNFVNNIKDIPNKVSNVWGSVKRGIQDIPKSASSAASSIKNSLGNGFRSILDRARSIFPGVKKQIKSGVEDPAKTAKMSIEDIASSIMSIQLVAKAFDLVKDSIGKAIDRIDTIDTATKSLTVLTGSGTIAKRVMDDLAAAIEGTPIALNDVAMGAKKMVAAGMEGKKVKGVFLAIADAAYGVGNGAESINQITDAIASMQSAGVVYSDDINRLVDAGIPAWQILANASQKSVTEMKKAVSEGTLEAGDAIEKLRQGIEEGTEGMAGSTAKMAGLAKTAGDTLSGSMANFRTAITTTIAKGLEPFKDVAVDALGSATQAMKDFRDNTIGSDRIQEILQGIAKALGEIKESSNPLISIVKGLFSALASFGGLVLLASTIIRITSLIGTFVAVAATNPFIIIAASVLGLAIALKDLYNRFEPFKKLIDGLRESFKQGLNGKYFSSDMNILEKGLYKLGESMKKVKLIAENLFAIFSGKSDYFQLSQLRDTGALADTTVDALAKILHFTNQVKAGFQAFFSVLRGESSSLDEVNNKFKSFISEDKLSVIYKLAEAVKSAFESIKEQFNQFKEAISSAFQSDFGPLTEFAQQLLPKIIAILVGGIPGLMLTGSRLISKLAEGMGITVPELLKKVIEIITSIIVGIAQLIPQLVETGVSIINTIIGAIVAALPAIIDAGIQILMALIQGVISVLPSLIDTAVQLFTTLVTALIEMLPLIIESGIKIIMALVEGILSVLPQLIVTALKLIVAIAAAIIQNLPQILKAGVEILLAIGKGIIDAIGQLLALLPEVFTSIIDAFLGVDWLQLGKDVLDSIGKGFKAGIDAVKGFFSEPIKEITDGFTESVDGIKQGSKGIFDNVVDSAKSGAEGAKGAWSDTKTWFSDLWTSIKDNASQAWSVFKEVILPVVQPLVDGVMSAFSVMKDYLEDTWNSLVTIASSAFEIMKNVILAPVLFVTSLISGGWDEAKNNMIAVWENIKEAALNIWESIKQLFVGYFTTIFTVCSEIWQGLNDTLINLWNEIVQGALTIWDQLKLFFSELWTNIKTGFVELWTATKEFAIQTWNDLVTSAVELWNAIVNFFATTWENLKTGFFNTWESIKQGVMSAWNAIKKFFEDTINNMVTSAQTAWDNLKQGVSDTIQTVKDTFDKLKDIDLFEIGKNIIDGLIKGVGQKIKDVKKKVKEVASSITDTFKNILDINSPSRVMIKLARWVPEGVAVAVDKGVPVVEKAVKSMTDTMTNAVQDAEPSGLTSNLILTESYGMPNASDMQASAVQASQAGNQGMADATPQLLQTALNAATGIVGQFTSIDPQMITEGSQWVLNFLTGWNTTFPIYFNQVTVHCNQIITLLRSFYNAINITGRTWLQNLLNGWNSLYQVFINRINQLGNDSINNLRSKSGGFHSAGAFLMQSLINGINSLSGSLDSTMRGIANKMVGGIGKGVNGVISGVNYVLKEVGSDKKISDWGVPQYAQGTDGHPADGPAIINDQKGSKYQEIVQNPDGSTFMAKGRNTLVWLKKGAKVLNATMTDRVMKAKQTLSKANIIPRYEDGVGEFDDFDFIDLLDNDQALSDLINKRVDYSGINEPWLNMTKSAVKLMSNAANPFVKSEVEKFYTHGTFDGAVNANGVYQYLVDVAQKVMAKFPGMTVTSGYRPGDIYYHGKRQAIDIAFPSSMNGSPRYTEAGNYAFEKFPKQVAYVITNGRVRDRMGLSGQGSSGQWVRWPDNDHFDHLHINGSMGSGDIFTGGGDISYGPGASSTNWAAQIQRAAAFMGQSITQSQINGILAQIQRESGGNQRIVQSSAVWDENMASGNPARGLLQYVPSTFNAYKVRGFEDIYNGFHQLIAFFNNSNWRNDIQYGRSGWGPRGSRIRGYKNGGWITEEGLYRAGEGNNPEMIIPLTKPKRAMKLIGQAVSYMTSHGSNILDSASIGLNNLASNMTLNLMDLVGVDTQAVRGSLAASAAGGILDLSEVVYLLQINNELLMDIVDKEGDVYMDTQKVGKVIEPSISEQQGKRQMIRNMITGGGS
ncbi:tape measure protein [Enterococcus sp. AZ109]|uniref:tape measure protein n=1 Tax=Enterococcus sp. AZ109 TaxID=2774634 RepID=UPI003F2103E8